MFIIEDNGSLTSELSFLDGEFSRFIETVF
jgi:hypothetical protein